MSRHQRADAEAIATFVRRLRPPTGDAAWGQAQTVKAILDSREPLSETAVSLIRLAEDQTSPPSWATISERVKAMGWFTLAPPEAGKKETRQPCQRPAGRPAEHGRLACFSRPVLSAPGR